MFYVWAVSEMRQFLYTSDNENLCVNIDVILVAFLPLLYYTTFCKLKVKYTIFLHLIAFLLLSCLHVLKVKCLTFLHVVKCNQSLLRVGWGLCRPGVSISAKNGFFIKAHFEV